MIETIWLTRVYLLRSGLMLMTKGMGMVDVPHAAAVAVKNVPFEWHICGIKTVCAVRGDLIYLK